MFAEIHQDIRGVGIYIFSIKYRKKDGTVGFKTNVSKSFKKRIIWKSTPLLTGRAGTIVTEVVRHRVRI